MAEPIPLRAFARLPAMDAVSVSPDGRYLAMIKSVGDTIGLVTKDLGTNSPWKPILGEDKKGVFRMQWCNWANDTRLVCGYQAMTKDTGFVYPVTRMVAVDVDGGRIKVLLQNTLAGGTQLQDRVIDWTDSDPDTILIATDKDENGFPEGYELNIYDGDLKARVRERKPLRQFVSDRSGEVRLGYGMEGKQLSYYARMADDNSWVKLEKFDAFSEGNRLRPIGITPERNKVYATGSHDGKDALWEMDLNDRDNPVLIFSHPLVDADSALLSKDGRMLGIYYETDRPFAFYTDRLAQAVIESVKPLLPAGNFNFIADYSRDEKVFVVQTQSDIDAGSYYVLDRATGKLLALGTAYPELPQAQLARKQSIVYTARDGKEIPGYLTVPVGKRPEHLPLIVMPHGGPTSRDSWSFDWLLQFLANRGYAVLQMNFRGSSGYGDEWLMAAHQDWGGLTYDDITDGTRWAVKQGIAAPDRVCIVGWSFGGYAALLGAVRNGELYRCSVSIAGVSDLIELRREEMHFTNGKIASEQIGTDADKLKEDSPRRHVDRINIPVLLIHGDMDYQVPFQHTENMVRDLKRANKPHRLVRVKDADHQMSHESNRVTLLTELESFLKANLDAR